MPGLSSGESGNSRYPASKEDSDHRELRHDEPALGNYYDDRRPISADESPSERTGETVTGLGGFPDDDLVCLMSCSDPEQFQCGVPICMRERDVHTLVGRIPLRLETQLLGQLAGSLRYQGDDIGGNSAGERAHEDDQGPSAQPSGLPAGPPERVPGAFGAVESDDNCGGGVGTASRQFPISVG
jgi:hypothetical protein